MVAKMVSEYTKEFKQEAVKFAEELGSMAGAEEKFPTDATQVAKLTKQSKLEIESAAAI